MAQLVLGAAGSAIGGALLPSGLNVLGAHITGAAIGGFIGSTLGAPIDQALTGQKRQYGPRITELPIQTSQDGAPIPILFGRARIAGQIIWAARLTERAEKSSAGGKGGGPTRVDYRYSVSFAVGLCEGEIAGIGRIWANGAPMDLKGAAYRVHTGGPDQNPDALIETIEGGSSTPGFRGLAYLVFEDLPLDSYGGRIPNLSVEVFRAPRTASVDDNLEQLVQAVDLIPASGEFAYATEAVVRAISAGRDQPENVNNGRGLPDLIAALDDLQAQLPNCRSILLVSAWFGDDLRCGECVIRPGVESRDKITRPVSWSVAGEDRSTAFLVTESGGQAVYGGTPSDASLIAAMQEITSRGLSVALYPFILMDIPAGNGLPDPWGGSEQGAFPWRGRISCHPAPGQPDSADQAADADTQVAAFFGTASADDFTIAGQAISYAGPAEWSFRRFILHHAALAKAGGASGFLIGSEMRGLTQVRGVAGFPAVDHLCALAAEARAILGGSVRLSYAADWSEYFGYHPADGSGDVYFHLDPLWSHPEIDAVAIDWYVPLSDWRDGSGHLDAAQTVRPHDRAYLASQLEGGEGYDWYYASAGDRDAQARTPITDGAYGKAWVFRYKDIRSWWSNPHHDRPGGVENAVPTGWVPRSKPIWLTETGCPAIDKGSNQPNVFVDPKSVESAWPHYSRGVRDDLIQRRYAEAVLDYWTPGSGNNPVSELYAGPMVDPDAIHIWTWDSRPFPDFPARSDIWADGANWRLGHWISGRAGLAPLTSVVEEICDRVGLAADRSALDGLVAGFLIDRPVTARSALEILSLAYGFDMADGPGGARFVGLDAGDVHILVPEALALSDAGSAITKTSAHRGGLPQDVRIRFVDDQGDYAPGSAHARHAVEDLGAILDLSWPLLADGEQAQTWAREILADSQAAAQSLEFAIPPSRLAIEAADLIRIGGAGGAGVARVISARGLSQRSVRAVGHAGRSGALTGSYPGGGPLLPWMSQPFAVVFDMPLLPGEGTDRSGPLAAVFGEPWSGEMRIDAGADPENLSERTRIRHRSSIGTILEGVSIAAAGRWHESASLVVKWTGGDAASVDPVEVLNGANLMAIETSSGRWELLRFASATLIATETYRLEMLLHDDVSGQFQVDAGARAVMLAPRPSAIPLQAHERATPLAYMICDASAVPGSVQCATGEFEYAGRDLEPLAPVHLRAWRDGAGLNLTWVRRTRIDGDDWAAPDVALGEADERYRIDILVETSVIATLETSSAGLTLAPEAEIEIFGGSASDFTLHIAQISQRFGAGRPARCDIHL